MKHFLTAILAAAACVLTAPIPARAADPVAEAREERFLSADEAFRDRADPERAHLALALYRKLYAETPRDPEAGWRLSMACYFAGFELTQARDLKRRLFAEGRDAGLAAIELDPRSAPAHFWTAVNMALYGQSVGVMKQLFTLGSIRGHLETCAGIDPSYAYGGAYRILGAIEQSLPGFLGGSKNDARRYFEQAISAVPDEPLNYLFLAKLLLEGYRDREGARAMALRGLKLTVDDRSRYESIKSLGEIRSFMRTNGLDSL